MSRCAGSSAASRRTPPSPRAAWPRRGPPASSAWAATARTAPSPWARRDVPLIPLSTGTNNVFPGARESTIAGLAAAAIATGRVDADAVAPRSKLIEVGLPGGREIALIDVAVLEGSIVGSRAIWEPATLREIVLTRADPAAVGLAAIGGAITSIGPDDDAGLHVRIGGGGEARRVRAPLAPGLVRDVSIGAVRRLDMAAIVPVAGPALLAFDGEREVFLAEGQSAQLRLTRAGPPVVDVDACLRAAREAGFLTE